MTRSLARVPCTIVTGFLGSGLGQSVSRKDFGRPLFQSGPARRAVAIPGVFGARPKTPGLFGAELFVRVIHHRVEPSLRLRVGEQVSCYPFFQGVPQKALFAGTLLSLPNFVIEKPRAAGSQGSPNDFGKLLFELTDTADPQDEDVPIDIGRNPLFEAAPRNQEGLLQGFLLRVETDLQD